MPVLSLVFDFSETLQKYEEIALELEIAISDGIEKLTASVYQHIVEQANQKLKSRKDIFLESLKPPEKIDEHTWMVELDKKAVWIDDGLPSGFDMLDGLLSSPKAKTGPKGRYLVVPFKHNKAPSKQTKLQQALVSNIKQEFKKKGIPFKPLERNPDGSPKLGRLHSMDLQGPKQKSQVVPPKQGPQGQNYQTHPRSQGQEGPGGRPYLWGLKVYQKEQQKGDKLEVQKSIMTFRTASESQRGQKFIHPGLAPASLFSEAYQWAEQQYDIMVDDIFKKFGIE